MKKLRNIIQNNSIQDKQWKSVESIKDRFLSLYNDDDDNNDDNDDAQTDVEAIIQVITLYWRNNVTEMIHAF